MNKIALIIKREFITRVRKKSFIIMTILGPLLFAGIMIIPIWLALRDTTDQKLIEVVDESGLFEGKFENKNLNFEFTDVPLDDAKSHLLTKDIHGLLYIPDINLFSPEGIQFFSNTNPSLEVIESIEKTLSNQIEEYKIGESGLSRETLESIRTSVDVNTINISERGERETNAEIATAVGYIFSFLIYFFIFLYGAQVMRGVIEEKSNRIVEVIISAVRPFHLMTGKIVGVASVGLAQFVLWVILTLIIFQVAVSYFDLNTVQQQPEIHQVVPQVEQSDIQPQAQDAEKLLKAFNAIDIPTVIISFIIYFLGGYFLYGALFAAVGSAADSDTDTQQFMLPITVPLIFSILVLSAVLKEPDGNLAFWLSMIPFTSPVVMMMRIPFEVPLWQLILSIVLLILGFVFTTWIAARIYRIGILVHGSKVNYKILGKWLLMKH